MMLKLKEITEEIGTGWFATHLLEKITTLQRQVAIHHADMNGMAWPNNLLGQMEAAIEQQNYTEARHLTLQWKQWIKGSKQIQEDLWRTLVLVEALIEFRNEGTKNESAD